MRTYHHSCVVRGIFVLFGFGFFDANLSAQVKESDAPKQATTTADPKIPIEHLKLLVKPMTKEELVVEADGWRDILQEKMREIAKERIGAEKLETSKGDAEKKAAIDARSEKAEVQRARDASDSNREDSSATLGSQSVDSNSTSVTPKAATSAVAVAEQSEQEQVKASKLIAQLTLQKSEIVQRLEVVLNDLKLKGGDVESYRLYMNALTGVAVQVSDASGLWTIFVAWIKSEQGGRRWAWNICKFTLTLVGFYFGASIISNFVRRAAGRVRGASQLLVNFLGTFVKQILMVIGVIVGLATLEVDVTPLLAAVGAAGFVVGFALQGTLSNFASGLLILAYRPFDVGDVIDAAGVSGMVDSVSLFSTKIRTFDNKVMIVPNNDIWGGTITNATASDTRRVDMLFGIGYEDDIEQAKSILRRLVNEHDSILKTPEPVIQVHELGDSSVNFVCRPWTNTANYWAVYWDLTQRVKEEFDRAGITIPYPQQDVHVYRQGGDAPTSDP